MALFAMCLGSPLSADRRAQLLLAGAASLPNVSLALRLVCDSIVVFFHETLIMIYRGFIWTTERLSVFPTGVLSEFYAIMTEDTDGRYGVPSCRTAAQITYWICVIRNQSTKPIGSPGFIEIKIVGPITNDCFNTSGVPGSVIYYVVNVGGPYFLSQVCGDGLRRTR